MARNWTSPGDSPTAWASSYAGIAGPGPTVKASERILPARYQLPPAKNAIKTLIAAVSMDHNQSRQVPWRLPSRSSVSFGTFEALRRQANRVTNSHRIHGPPRRNDRHDTAGQIAWPSYAVNQGPFGIRTGDRLREAGRGGAAGLWEAARVPMAGVPPRHDRIVRELVEAAGGRVFQAVGEAHRAVFADPVAALLSAGAVQGGAGGGPWAGG